MRLATRVMRKHRLAERLLTDVIGLDWELVHAEACRWEHVMSETVERRLVDLLGHPTESPYGNPIPGLGELGRDRLRRASSSTAPSCWPTWPARSGRACASAGSPRSCRRTSR